MRRAVGRSNSRSRKRSSAARGRMGGGGPPWLRRGRGKGRSGGSGGTSVPGAFGPLRYTLGPADGSVRPARGRCTGGLMTDTITESFCERCGTRYSFEKVSKPRRGGIGRVRVLSRGIKNYVANDGMPMAEAMAAARDDEQRTGVARQLDAFHKTFNFCMSCRQYTCATCWNEKAGECLSCAPDLSRELPAEPVAVLAPAPFAAGNGHDTVDAMSWPRVDLDRDELEDELESSVVVPEPELVVEEPDVLARLNAFVAAPAHPPVEELTPDELAEVELALAGTHPVVDEETPLAEMVAIEPVTVAEEAVAEPSPPSRPRREPVAAAVVEPAPEVVEAAPEPVAAAPAVEPAPEEPVAAVEAAGRGARRGRRGRGARRGRRGRGRVDVVEPAPSPSRPSRPRPRSTSSSPRGRRGRRGRGREPSRRRPRCVEPRRPWPRSPSRPSRPRPRSPSPLGRPRTGRGARRGRRGRGRVDVVEPAPERRRGRGRGRRRRGRGRGARRGRRGRGRDRRRRTRDRAGGGHRRRCCRGRRRGGRHASSSARRSRAHRRDGRGPRPDTIPPGALPPVSSGHPRAFSRHP